VCRYQVVAPLSSFSSPLPSLFFLEFLPLRDKKPVHQQGRETEWAPLFPFFSLPPLFSLTLPLASKVSSRGFFFFFFPPSLFPFSPSPHLFFFFCAVGAGTRIRGEAGKAEYPMLPCSRRSRVFFFFFPSFFSLLFFFLSPRRGAVNVCR